MGVLSSGLFRPIGVAAGRGGLGGGADDAEPAGQEPQQERVGQQFREVCLGHEIRPVGALQDGDRRARHRVDQHSEGEPAGDRQDLAGKRAAVYTGGAFKAFSLVRSLRTLGMKTVLAGSQTGNQDDYRLLRELCDDDTILGEDGGDLIFGNSGDDDINGGKGILIKILSHNRIENCCVVVS